MKNIEAYGCRIDGLVKVVLPDSDARYYGFGKTWDEAIRDAEDQREDDRATKARITAKAHALLHGGAL